MPLRYVRFSLDPAMRSISSARLGPAYGFFRRPTAIVPMKPSNTFVRICAKKMFKTDRESDKMQLWRTLTVV